MDKSMVNPAHGLNRGAVNKRQVMIKNTHVFKPFQWFIFNTLNQPVQYVPFIQQNLDTCHLGYKRKVSINYTNGRKESI
jgi:hypothetical protein